MTKRLEVRDNLNNLLAYLSLQDGVKDCQVDLNLNGTSTLIFSVPFTSNKHQYLVRGNHIVADGRDFIISAPTEGKGPKRNFDTIHAEESWIALSKIYPTVPVDNVPLAVTILSGEPGQGGFSDGSAGSALYRLLQGSGWNVGTVDVGGIFDLETEKLSLLANISRVQELWGGFLVWDSKGKVLHLRDEELMQPYNGFQVRYKKNIKEITRIIDNDIITKLYPFGQDDLNIASVNNGSLYIENFSYTTEILEGVWQNQNIYDATLLKAAAEKYLKKMCRPRYTYTIKIVDLRSLPEYAHESFTLGDIVDVIDEDMGINEKQRIVSYKYDYFQPWKCELNVGEPGYSIEREIAEMLKIREKISTITNYNNQVSGYNVINNSISNDKIISLDPDKLEPTKTGEKAVDSHGLNPEFFKFYPNQVYNSSFERFNLATKKPDFWDTSGEVTPNSRFDNTYSLKLEPGQYAKQKEETGIGGLADPAWWSWWCPDTRYSFRVKGSGGKVKVQVLQSSPVPLWTWQTIEGVETKVYTEPPHELEF